MALKFKLTKAEYDALPDVTKALYKLAGDEATLEVEGTDDAAELKRAKDRETAEAKKQKDRADKAERELQEARDATSREKGDVAALDKSWQLKMDAAVAAEKENTKKAQKLLTNTLVDKEAMNIAIELGGDSAPVLLPHIAKRLKAEYDGEIAITRVLDKDGKPSALSLADLKKEISDDKVFAPIVVAGRASGGGAAGGNRTSGGAGSGDKKFKDLNDAERTEFYKRDPKAFQQAVEDNRRVF